MFLAGVFASVVAHEFGHAGAAAMYGIKTADITLLPIGGLARLTELPKNPLQELVIAVAGPAVNVVIAAVLGLLLLAGVQVPLIAPAIFEADILTQLLYANCFLCCFNLLPAFPMDGGRVLRSFLAMKASYIRATEIAARVGRWMALAFVIAAFVFKIWTLIILALFVVIAGTMELWQVRFREVAQQSAQGQAAGGARGSPWAQQPWPQQQADYSGPSTSQGGDVVDAVEVREIK
ncbi:MAG: M50 family metallopeptidase [Planctomycetota bacterium]